MNPVVIDLNQLNKLQSSNAHLETENTYLKIELEKYKLMINKAQIDFIEYEKLKEQLGNSIETIKHMSNLL